MRLPELDAPNCPQVLFFLVFSTFSLVEIPDGLLAT